MKPPPLPRRNAGATTTGIGVGVGSEHPRRASAALGGAADSAVVTAVPLLLLVVSVSGVFFLCVLLWPPPPLRVEWATKQLGEGEIDTVNVQVYLHGTSTLVVLTIAPARGHGFVSFRRALGRMAAHFECTGGYDECFGRDHLHGKPRRYQLTKEAVYRMCETKRPRKLHYCANMGVNVLSAYIPATLALFAEASRSSRHASSEGRALPSREKLHGASQPATAVASVAISNEDSVSAKVCLA